MIGPSREHWSILYNLQISFYCVFSRFVTDTHKSGSLYVSCTLISSLVDPGVPLFQMPARGKYNEDLSATIRFINTIKINLTNGVFRLEGAGLTKPQIIRQK